MMAVGIEQNVKRHAQIARCLPRVGAALMMDELKKSMKIANGIKQCTEPAGFRYEPIACSAPPSRQTGN